MFEVLCSVVLGPVLLAQGLYTRWTTPRLAEPSGEREGISGAGSGLRLLILGDSAAAGVGVATQAEALSGQLVGQLSADLRVTWRLLAQSGLDIRGVQGLVEGSAPERFDAVVVSVGVNDVTRNVSAEQWVAGLERLIELLQWKYEARYVLLSRVPPLHAFPALPQPLRWYLGCRARRFNQRLVALVGQRPQTLLLEEELALSREMMATDGFHPGAAIYQRWAVSLAALLHQRLAAQPVPERARSLAPQGDGD